MQLCSDGALTVHGWGAVLRVGHEPEWLRYGAGVVNNAPNAVTTEFNTMWGYDHRIFAACFQVSRICWFPACIRAVETLGLS